jgi:hypothetical protein
MTTANRLGLVATAGAVVAVVLFVLTSQVSILHTYSTPVCGPGEELRVDQPAFDLVTGMPHGRSVSCVAAGSSRQILTLAPEADLAGRRAIPLPIGFIIGAVAASVSMLVDGRHVIVARRPS